MCAFVVWLFGCSVFSQLLSETKALRVSQQAHSIVAWTPRQSNESGQAPLRQASKEIIDEPAVNVVTVACGGFMKNKAPNLIRSFLAQAKLDGGRKPTLHVFTDKDGKLTMMRMKSSESDLWESADVHVHDVQNITADMQFANQIKPCNCLRVYLPRLFPTLSKIMYMDADTMVVRSLKPLFNIDVPVFAMAEDGGRQYDDTVRNCPSWKNGSTITFKSSDGKEKCHPYYRGLNAGVYLLNLDNWRSYGMDQRFEYWISKILSGEAVFPYVEQDIFNLIAVEHSDWHVRLPCEANSLFYNRYMCYYGTGDYDSMRASSLVHFERNSRQPIVLHSKFGYGYGNQEWRFMESRLTWAIDQVSTEANLGRSSQSLCDMVNCSGMILERAYTNRCEREHEGEDIPNMTCTLPPGYYLEEDEDTKKLQVTWQANLTGWQIEFA